MGIVLTDVAGLETLPCHLARCQSQSMTSMRDVRLWCLASEGVVTELRLAEGHIQSPLLPEAIDISRTDDSRVHINEEKVMSEPYLLASECLQ